MNLTKLSGTPIVIVIEAPSVENTGGLTSAVYKFVQCDISCHRVIE